MTRAEAIAQIEATLPVLTTEQAAAIAELTAAWTRAVPAEDATTVAAIREGMAQADNGAFVEPSKVEALLGRVWR